MNKQIWYVPLQCGCIARETLNIELLNRVLIVKVLEYVTKKEVAKNAIENSKQV